MECQGISREHCSVGTAGTLSHMITHVGKTLGKQVEQVSI